MACERMPRAARVAGLRPGGGGAGRGDAAHRQGRQPQAYTVRAAGSACFVW